MPTRTRRRCTCPPHTVADRQRARHRAGRVRVARVCMRVRACVGEWRGGEGGGGCSCSCSAQRRSACPHARADAARAPHTLSLTGRGHATEQGVCVWRACACACVRAWGSGGEEREGGGAAAAAVRSAAPHAHTHAPTLHVPPTHCR